MRRRLAAAAKLCTRPETELPAHVHEMRLWTAMRTRRARPSGHASAASARWASSAAARAAAGLTKAASRESPSPGSAGRTPPRFASA